MAEAKETKKTVTRKEEVEAAVVAETMPVAEITDVVETVEVEAAMDAEPKAIAKAGKRSAKAIKETEEKVEKEERKTKTSEEAAEDKPKIVQKPARTRLERRGKKFRKSAEAIDATKSYALEEAIDLAAKASPVKFDATVELHLNLNVDPRHADQNIRDNLVLPAGTGKTVRIALLDDAKVEGVEISGVDTVLKALDKGELNFDILIASPANMAKLGKYARTLGPRGLMPNPKSGTVTTDVAKAVAEAKAGRVEYRVDTTGIIHLGVGKVSFGKDSLVQNVQAVLASVKANKPASVKSGYFKAAHVTTSMGPSVTIEISSIN